MKNKLLAKLSRSIPCCVTEKGLSLNFDENLTPKELRKVCEQWPLFSAIETPAGVFLTEYPPKGSPSEKIRLAVEKAVRGPWPIK
jgi:transposase